MPGAIGVEDVRDIRIAARTCSSTGADIDCRDEFSFPDDLVFGGTIDAANTTLYMEFSCLIRLVPGGVSQAEAICQPEAGGLGSTHGCAPVTITRPGGTDSEYVDVTGQCSINYVDNSTVNIGVQAASLANAEVYAASYSLSITPKRDVRFMPEEITLLPLDQWIPFAAFAALAVWGWHMRSTLTALVGTIGMLSTFVITGWALPVLVLAGTIVIWIEYLRTHRGEAKGGGI